MKKQIKVGDSTRGYDSAMVVINAQGKARLIGESVVGRITVIRKCIANYNKGVMSYTTTAGDELPISVS